MTIDRQKSKRAVKNSYAYFPGKSCTHTCKRNQLILKLTPHPTMAKLLPRAR